MRKKRLLPILLLTTLIGVAGCPGQDQRAVETPRDTAPTAAPPAPGLGPAEAGTTGPPRDTLLDPTTVIEGGPPAPGRP